MAQAGRSAAADESARSRVGAGCQGHLQSSRHDISISVTAGAGTPLPEQREREEPESVRETRGLREARGLGTRQLAEHRNRARQRQVEREACSKQNHPGGREEQD
ncbi:hypothetical protein NDU88_000782 [Pleurodeles waltl]|uniref:Uncharacterized protein n=1 Tax=Pleurodeles waltl TaxID=8319 RepID=A0AAV7KPV0_PLEWA|nr:hypothetical protein NDU88_000782 [Pleurodeles waltl]